ncbi:MAG: glycosyltransferase [Balneolaceae bacterium]
MNKKRILFCGEASPLNTGFSTYYHELLKRLYASGKYEIAELGSYISGDDPRLTSVPWKIYPVMPSNNDKTAWNIYRSDNTNQFGKAIFESALLDFKPDIVADIRDMWMCSFQADSPLRDFFSLLWMPTVDGEPQRQEWLDYYKNADGLLTYSKYGLRLLEQGGCKNVIGKASPGADLENMYPVENKEEHRKKLGIPHDAFVVGTIMRNQKRKLFPDLIRSFKLFIDTCNKKGKYDLAKKSVLYLHTSYPDVGFDIPRHVLENGLQDKVITTFKCEECGHISIAMFSGETTKCNRCGKLTARTTSPSTGVSRNVLGQIINLFDVYVQYSTCEGFGLPINEARACGVPVMATDYSAMSEQVHEPGGFPIRIERYFDESVMETEQRRALPDNQHLAKLLFKFATLPKEDRKKLSKAVRKVVEENYTWEQTANMWEKAIDNLPPPKRKWDDQPKFLNLPKINPEKTMYTDLVKMAYKDILGKELWIGGYCYQQELNVLQGGHKVGDRGKATRMSKKDWWKQVEEYVDNYNRWEQRRTNMMNPPKKSKDITVGVI